MASNLKVDLDQMSRSINEYQSAINDFKDLKTSLKGTIDTLKNSGWKSGASTAYFETFDTTWEKNISLHITILEHLQTCMTKAKADYEDLYNNMPNLTEV